jgi:hypothetical protein
LSICHMYILAVEREAAKHVVGAPPEVLCGPETTPEPRSALPGRGGALALGSWKL